MMKTATIIGLVLIIASAIALAREIRNAYLEGKRSRKGHILREYQTINKDHVRKTEHERDSVPEPAQPDRHR